MSAPKPRRPVSLKIGYVPFDVEYLSEEEWQKRGLDDNDGGQTEAWKGSILIRCPENLHEVMVQEVLLHEILHACVYVSGLSVEGARHWHGDIEEEFIHRTSPVLLQVLKDNPKLAAYLMS